MANLLTIEKLDNSVFLFTLNGDTINSVRNIRNDLTIIGNKCHFKSANGANIIKEQDIVYGNITLIDGVTTIIPTSNDDLFDELTALGFFDWILSSGGGVNRFTELLDGFSFTNQALKIVRVNVAETQLEAIENTLISRSTDLEDMPAGITPGSLLIGNNDGSAYTFITPANLPVSDATAAAISTISVLPLTYFDYSALEEDGIQEFTVPFGREVKFMLINSAVQTPLSENNTRIDTFAQSGTTVTLTQPTYAGYYISGYYQ